MVQRKSAERLTSRDSVPDSEIEVVRMKCPCGWCITNQCGECLPELYWEKKLYMCGCKKCCNGHVPSVAVDNIDDDVVQSEHDEDEPIHDGDVSDEDAS